MKKINNKFAALVFSLAILLVGCESYLGDDINVNPNQPTAVPVNVILPAVEVFLTDVDGGDFSRNASVLMQQTEGVARQWSSINNYSSFNVAHINTLWNNVYENILVEISGMKTTANTEGYSHFEGVANILMAYTLMNATDVWDDIPYSQAFQGSDLTNPIFDTQASIYTEIFTLITDGKALLGGSDGGLPLSNDVFYDGDVAKWIKLANALEARGRLHLGEPAAALTAEASAFDEAGDNLSYTYPDAGSAHPWYRFNRDRNGDIEFHPTMKALMEGLTDTSRLAMYSPTFTPDEHPYLVPDMKWELISFREMKFLEAEALLATSGSGTAIHTAYIAGITASFAHLGISNAELDGYLAGASVDPGVGNVTLEHIMTQKYIALFTHLEVYNDWRRTGIPTLSPVSGINIPVRFPYGSDEHLFNSEAPDAESVDVFTAKVGWDN